LKRKYRILSTIVVVILCIIVYYFHTISNNGIQDLYSKSTYESIYELKKSFLRDTVNNQIAHMNDHVKSETENAALRVGELEIILSRQDSDHRTLEFYRGYFDDKTIYDTFTAVVWDANTKKVLYDSKGILKVNTFEQMMKEIPNDFASWKIIPSDNLVVLYGITKSYVDNRVKELAAKEIHGSQFAENSYIWVNEIVNYKGGDGYAIRRVHPNLPETEGEYLSTSMTDIKGNFPYLEELNGVTEHGEIFFTYYFKKKDSEAVSKKLTYAKLYKSYDWVVAMGVHIDDTDMLVDSTTERGMKLSNDLSFHLFSLLAVILTVTVMFLVALEKWVFGKSKKILEDKINIDQLTGALSRTAGDRNLTILRTDFIKSNSSPAICMFDIDFFKNINDTYGHDVGDLILQRVVNRVQETVRSTDSIYRWGGDEFILVCPGVEREKAIRIFNKIRIEISRADEQDPCGHIMSTVSMGVSYFNEMDHDILDVIKRADIAMYKAKENGRDCIELQI